MAAVTHLLITVYVTRRQETEGVVLLI